MHAVLFQTYLLTIGIEQIHVIVTDFSLFEVQTNSSNKSTIVPRHCVVPETLTTILIEKMPLCDGHALVRSAQNTDCTKM